MLFQFLRALGLTDLVATINCIPKGESRAAFSRALQKHVESSADRLGPDDRKRLSENPLRLFDSKDPAVQEILASAPRTLDFLDDASRAHHEELKRLLPHGGVRFEESARIVRGIDYYTLTVFEVSSSALGAQNAILGGGRYDGLVADLGGPSMPAVGFAIGEDRLVQAAKADPRTERSIFIVIPDSREDFGYALDVANDIRTIDRKDVRGVDPGFVVETDLTGRGIPKGLARAGLIVEDPSKYSFHPSGVFAVVLGLRERESATVTIKNLRSRTQETFPRTQLAEKLGAARDR
jgi:histidyl-tRNA synthetase